MKFAIDIGKCQKVEGNIVVKMPKRKYQTIFVSQKTSLARIIKVYNK